MILQSYLFPLQSNGFFQLFHFLKMNYDQIKTPSKVDGFNEEDTLPDTPFQRYEDLAMDLNTSLNSSLNQSLNSSVGEIELDVESVAFYESKTSATDSVVRLIPNWQFCIALLVFCAVIFFNREQIVKFIEQFVDAELNQ